MAAETKQNDPVAAKSTFLCMYMSNHPDTLVAYVKYWGKVKEPVVSAEMASIDSNGMDLRYKVKNGGDTKHSIRVAFDPPLVGYEEVKPRLLAMTADAQESLGMTKAPHIPSFRLTPSALIPLPAILLLIYTTLAPTQTGGAWVLGKALWRTFGGAPAFRWIWAFLVVTHVLESLYVANLCRRHRTGWVVRVQYVLSTLICGVGVLLPLQKYIQKLRIDSIMKGN